VALSLIFVAVTTAGPESGSHTSPWRSLCSRSRRTNRNKMSSRTTGSRTKRRGVTEVKNALGPARLGSAGSRRHLGVAFTRFEPEPWMSPHQRRQWALRVGGAAGWRRCGLAALRVGGAAGWRRCGLAALRVARIGTPKAPPWARHSGNFLYRAQHELNPATIGGRSTCRTADLHRHSAREGAIAATRSAVVVA
jgi:hypothetical protein